MPTTKSDTEVELDDLEILQYRPSMPLPLSNLNPFPPTGSSSHLSADPDLIRILDNLKGKQSIRCISGPLHSTPPPPPPIPGTFELCIDIYEDPNSKLVTVMVELPGMRKNTITIELCCNELVISGERVSKEGWNDKGYIIRERGFGKFKRTVTLPKIKDVVKARNEEGLLIISYVKAGPEEIDDESRRDFTILIAYPA